MLGQALKAMRTDETVRLTDYCTVVSRKCASVQVEVAASGYCDVRPVRVSGRDTGVRAPA